MSSIADHTLGSIAGHALELFTCAPSIRNGAPSTKSAYRPFLLTSCGMGKGGAELDCASPETKRKTLQIAARTIRIDEFICKSIYPAGVPHFCWGGGGSCCGQEKSPTFWWSFCFCKWRNYLLGLVVPTSF